jgi:hypothetical protein
VPQPALRYLDVGQLCYKLERRKKVYLIHEKSLSDMPKPSDHIEMVVYEDDTATIATSFQPAPLFYEITRYFMK